MQLRIKLAGACAIVLAAGCYEYVPPPEGRPATGRDVRVQLTDAGTAAVAPVVGPRVVAVDGRLTAISDSALTLAATGTTKENGVEDLWRGEQVIVPRAYVASVAQRAFSRRRTVTASVIGLALTAGAYALIGPGGVSGSAGGHSGGPGGQQ